MTTTTKLAARFYARAAAHFLRHVPGRRLAARLHQGAAVAPQHR